MNVNTDYIKQSSVSAYQTVNNQTVGQGTYENQKASHPEEREQSKVVGENDIAAVIEKANHIQAGTTECQFSIHKETNQIMIKVVDTTTKKVIKEIPSEKILDMVASMCELAGVFVDEKR